MTEEEIYMNQRYIDYLHTFTSEDLVHKFDKIVPESGESCLVLTDKWLGQADITVAKHDWRMHSMYHSLMLLKFSYICSGTFMIYTDGKPTALPAGSLCIVPPDTVQKFTIDYGQPNTEDTVMFNILVRASEVKRLFPSLFTQNNPVSDYLTHALSGESCPKFMLLKAPSEFTHDTALLAYSELMRALESGDSRSFGCDLVAALINSYLASPCRVIETASLSNDEKDPVGRILHFIRQNAENVTLSGLCAEFHYTPSYVCRIIRKHTGRTFKEYLNDEKLDNFCRALMLTDKSVRTLADEAGFTTLEHFYRVFRKKYGMPPARYREILRKQLF